MRTRRTGGHLEVMRWARQHNCPCNAGASEGGRPRGSKAARGLRNFGGPMGEGASPVESVHRNAPRQLASQITALECALTA